jgi:hypothetical protein
MERPERHAGADALVRGTLSLRDAALRASYISTVARAWPPAVLARALDALCERAERAETHAREALLSVVDALNGEAMADLVLELRATAAAESLLALERLIRQASRPTTHSSPPGDGAGQESAASRGGTRADAPRTQGRVLTLGERKWLARRPDRAIIQRLLADPHPDVVRRCLQSPKVTEDDVLRLAAKRPGRAEVLAEVARSPWFRRPRIRLALVLNPATPMEIAIRASGLLLRPELSLVARSPGVSASVRALALEHLERRPPYEGRAQRGKGSRIH